MARAYALAGAASDMGYSVLARRCDALIALLATGGDLSPEGAVATAVAALEETLAQSRELSRSAAA